MIIFRGVLTAVSRHPIIFAITGIVAGLTAIGTAMGVFNKNTEDTVDPAKEIQEALDNYSPPIRAATEETGKFRKQLSKIDDQINKANEDYRYNLAQLVADKNKNIAQLRETLRAEKKSYDNAFAERLASFNKSQHEEELSHKQKVKELQNQINFLSKYNTAANKQQVEELKFALAQENAEYKKSTQLRKAEFDAQTKSA